MTEKAELRKEKKALILGDTNREIKDQIIIEKIKANPHFKNAKKVLAFIPKEDEPNITPLFDDRFYFPEIINKEMYFSQNGTLVKSKVGFMEMQNGKREDNTSALVLVPLLAYDSLNNRLGRGGGYYDRFLRKNRDRLYLIGVAYSQSFSFLIPVEEFDVKLDEIITN